MEPEQDLYPDPDSLEMLDPDPSPGFNESGSTTLVRKDAGVS